MFAVPAPGCLPHLQSVPSALKAKVVPPPDVTLTQLLSVPTLVGTSLSMFVPSPKFPLLLLPHIQSDPSALMAADTCPVATPLIQSLSVPTRLGIAEPVPKGPEIPLEESYPNCSSLSEPHAQSVPSDLRPILWSEAVLTLIHFSTEL